MSPAVISKVEAVCGPTPKRDSSLGQPGVLDVGQLVQINATIPWRGRVRAVTVNSKRPSLRQTVTLVRHLETV